MKLGKKLKNALGISHRKRVKELRDSFNKGFEIANRAYLLNVPGKQP
jgi:hypothetical protein